MKSTNKLSLGRTLALLIVAVLYLLFQACESQQVEPASSINGKGFTRLSDLQNAFENQRSDFQVKQKGVIVKVLSDDSRGSRHQRFIVKLDSGQKLLIAHNIDLAPRVPDPAEGSSIAFYGEYEWNNKGGVIHWTHHDPRQRHIDGWLEYHGKRYD